MVEVFGVGGGGGRGCCPFKVMSFECVPVWLITYTYKETLIHYRTIKTYKVEEGRGEKEKHKRYQRESQHQPTNKDQLKHLLIT